MPINNPTNGLTVVANNCSEKFAPKNLNAAPMRAILTKKRYSSRSTKAILASDRGNVS